MLIQVLIITLLVAGIFYILNLSEFRRSTDVLNDLREERLDDGSKSEDKFNWHSYSIGRAMRALPSAAYLEAGFFNAQEAKRYFLRLKLTPVVVSLIIVLICVLFRLVSERSLVTVTIISLALSYLYTRFSLAKRKDNFSKEIDFYLPLVMERLVMAAQSGLDIVPAIKTVVDVTAKTGDKANSQFDQKKSDTVCRLLGIVYQLSEAGLSFQESLSEVASRVKNNSIKHAFIHLGLAHKEGGELVKPLRELSDSTQLYFQESIEEEIARMPVKATMPLLCTFAGLIVCFLTVPIIQLMSMTAKAIMK